MQLFHCLRKLQNSISQFSCFLKIQICCSNIHLQLESADISLFIDAFWNFIHCILFSLKSEIFDAGYNRSRRYIVGFVIVHLYFSPPTGNIHCFLHRSGHLTFIRIKNNMSVRISGSTSYYLNKRLSRT